MEDLVGISYPIPKEKIMEDLVGISYPIPKEKIMEYLDWHILSKICERFVEDSKGSYFVIMGK